MTDAIGLVGRRLLARAIDAGWLVVAGFVVFVVILPVLRSSSDGVPSTGSSLLLAAPVAAVVLGWLESRRGATPGKRLVELEVLGSDGGRLSLGPAIARNLVVFAPWMLPPGLFGPALVFVLLLSVLLSEEGRGYHDQLAGAWIGRIASAPAT